MEDFIVASALSLDSDDSDVEEQEAGGFNESVVNVSSAAVMRVNKRLSGLGPKQSMYINSLGDHDEAKKIAVTPQPPEDTLVELNILIMQFPECPKEIPKSEASTSSAAVQTITDNLTKTWSSAAASGASLFSSFKGYISR